MSEFLCGNADTILYECSLGCCSMTSRDNLLPCCCQKERSSHPSLMPGCLPASLFPSAISHASFMLARVLLSPLREPVQLVTSAENYLWWGWDYFSGLLSHSFSPLNQLTEGTLDIRRAQGNSRSAGQDGRSRSTLLQQQ